MNQWTHGTLITPMHGHLAFFGAYGMIILAMMTYSLPPSYRQRDAEERTGRRGSVGLLAQVVRDHRDDPGFAAAGIAQVYMERIMGVGYLETRS